MHVVCRRSHHRRGLHPDADGDTDTYADAIAHCNPLAHRDTVADRHRHRDGVCDRDRDADCDVGAWRDGNSVGYRQPDGKSGEQRVSDSHRQRHGHRDGHRHGDGRTVWRYQPDAERDAVGDRDGDTDGDRNAGAADRAAGRRRSASAIFYPFSNADADVDAYPHGGDSGSASPLTNRHAGALRAAGAARSAGQRYGDASGSGPCQPGRTAATRGRDADGGDGGSGARPDPHPAAGEANGYPCPQRHGHRESLHTASDR
jgi:hypothetical protein